MSVLPEEGPYDCQACGACCVEAGSVILIQSDQGIPAHLLSRHKTGQMEVSKYMGGRCKALEGVIGSCVSCSIYENRPQVCKQFEPGSPGCEEARSGASHKMNQMEWRPRGYGEDWLETVE